MSCRIFIHGLESSNQGTKAVFFRENYPDMITPYFTGPLPQRMEKLNSILSDQTGIILVGSSFGGLMASIFALENERRVAKLILLAPAIHLMEFARDPGGKVSLPVWIYHGRQDEVIAIKDVERAAGEVFADLRFHAVDDDHYLHKTFKKIPWDQLLS
jgi:pimeloyl-ACP methyl ester carboxylesterase